VAAGIRDDQCEIELDQQNGELQMGFSMRDSNHWFICTFEEKKMD
jgi:hypothetical protein